MKEKKCYLIEAHTHTQLMIKKEETKEKNVTDDADIDHSQEITCVNASNFFLKTYKSSIM